MRDGDRLAFAKGLYALGEAFNEPVSELRAEAYFDALADLPVRAVLDAMRTAIRDGRFFPRPVEIREYVEGRPEDRAELAWTALLRLVRRYGWPGIDGKGKAPNFPDEATRGAALELYGGWSALCARLPSEGPEFLGAAKQFKAAYLAYSRRESLAALPPSKNEVKALLRDVKGELVARSLPTGDL